MSVCQEFDLLRVVEANICAAEAIDPPAKERPVTEADIFARFGDLFDARLELLHGTVHLDLDPSFRPVHLSSYLFDELPSQY